MGIHPEFSNFIRVLNASIGIIMHLFAFWRFVKRWKQRHNNGDDDFPQLK